MKENVFEGRFELARLTCCFALQIVAPATLLLT